MLFFSVPQTLQSCKIYHHLILKEQTDLVTIFNFFFTNVYLIQDPKATESKGLLNKVCDMEEEVKIVKIQEKYND